MAEENRKQKVSLHLVPPRNSERLTPEEELLLLKKGNPCGPIILECGKPPPYLTALKERIYTAPNTGETTEKDDESQSV